MAVRVEVALRILLVLAIEAQGTEPQEPDRQQARNGTADEQCDTGCR